MKKLFSILILGLCFVSLSAYRGWGQDVGSIADELYSGLADIIENNMNDADACIAKVDNYYKANQDKVVAIRTAVEKAIEQASPKTDEYMSMSKEELEALSKKAEEQQQAGGPQMSPAGKRYTDALKVFTMKYPKAGMKIGMEAMQLIPGFKQQD